MQVRVEPHAAVEVPVLFRPSSLGAGEHKTDISFISEQVQLTLHVCVYVYIETDLWLLGETVNAQ